MAALSAEVATTRVGLLATVEGREVHPRRSGPRGRPVWWASGVPLTTFDCFDTLVTRAVGDPASIGYVVARRLRAAGVCDVEGGAYVARRAEAGLMVFRHLVDRATLADVAVQLADLLGLPADTAPALAATEVAVEVELVRSVPNAAAAMASARAAGEQVAVLTDTVLPPEVVRRLLDTAGACDPDVPLWVSNAMGAGKGRGTAYAAVARAMGRVPGRWRHVGDDDRADVAMARAAGVRPAPATRGRLTRHERAWERGALASGGLASLVAGAARRTRLVAEVELPAVDGSRASALTGVAVPLAAAYVLWALARARAAGAGRLVLDVDPRAALVPFARALADATGGGIAVVTVAPGAAHDTAARSSDGSAGEVVAGWGWDEVERPGGSARAERALAWRVGPAGGARGWLRDAAAGTGPAGSDTAGDRVLGALLDELCAARPDDGEVGAILGIFAAELAPVLPLLDASADLRAPAWRAVEVLSAGQPTPGRRRRRLTARAGSVRRHAGAWLAVTARRLPVGRPPSGSGSGSGPGSAPASVPAGAATRYEARLRTAVTDEARLPALLADASAAVRAGAAGSGLAAPLVEVTAGVAGPLLSGYVLWCLQRAREAGCRRVRFVSRDGEVLLRLALRITAARGEEGWDLRYLHGNRRAWLLPSLSGLAGGEGGASEDVERIATVAGRGRRVSARDVLAWVSLSPEDAADELAAAGFPATSWDEPLTWPRRRAVLGVLDQPRVAAHLARLAETARADAERYLHAQGLLGGEPFVMVDMEGHGNVGALLTALLERLGAPPPVVECYVALTKPAPAPGRDPLGYLYDDAAGTGVRERSGEAYVALEMFGAGSHGTVLGYRSTGGRDGTALPVLASPGNDRVLAWGLGAYRDLLDAYGDALGTALAAEGEQVAAEVAAEDAGATTWAVLRELWERPTPGEVALWGTFPSPDGGRHAIGDGFTTAQVIASLRQGEVSMRPHGTWPAAVRARAPWHLRTVQHQVEQQRRRRVALAGTPPPRPADPPAPPVVTADGREGVARAPRVLVVEHRLHEDGATRSTLRLVARWSRAHVPVVLFAVRRPHRGTSAPVPDGVTVTYPAARDPRGRALLALALLRLVPHARRADVVVSGRDVGWGLLLGRAASWAARRPFVVVVRSNPRQAIEHHLSPRLRAATRLAYRTADRVVCISPGLVPAVVAMGVRAPRVVVALGGVEVEQILGAAASPAPGLPDGQGPLVVAVGRLERQKGFDVLVRAHAAVVAAGTAHRLLVMGEGVDRRALERLAADLGVAGSVHLPGFHPDPLPTIAAADLFVLSSRWEGMGQSLAEALLLGTPVIAADCVAGPRTLLADGAHGDLVPVDDVDALAAAIARHLAAPQRLRDAARVGSGWAQEHLDIDRAAQETLAAVTMAAARSGTGGGRAVTGEGG